MINPRDLTAEARLVPDGELALSAQVFSSRDPQVTEFGVDQLQGSAPLRLYRARAVEFLAAHRRT